ncbi:aspartyl-phosphate phosphatase Spo0E family protein [Aneurinibacillus tyrosinisolvens]|uniref:aspartyl-phosphate phosphatase Spo0E family protein n=1 Tax=Aneurinibacillus tyrosinisolvens TaxID=1443435 RepID=UPI000AAB97AF|nr:aspartyl-phosphate phosphatase Spo0E family protein [Aneurinibacillus tyrosinisolvens]
MKIDMRTELLLTIEELKKVMTEAAKAHGFDFQHPKVLHFSRELDHLIVKLMKSQPI